MGLARKAGLCVAVVLGALVVLGYLSPQYPTEGGVAEGVASSWEVHVVPPLGSLIHVRDYYLVVSEGVLSEIVVQIYNADRPLRIYVHVYFYDSSGEEICRASGHYDVVPPGATVSVDVPDLEISRVSTLVIELKPLPSPGSR